jgi:plastocyanin
MRRVVLLIGVAAAVLAAAGCGSSPPSATSVLPPLLVLEPTPSTTGQAQLTPTTVASAITADSRTPAPAAGVVRHETGVFTPRRVTILAGERLTFENASYVPIWPASNIHPSHQVYPGFDALGPVEPGATWSYTFDRPGVWRYHNHLAPDQGGVIVVEGELGVAPEDPLIVDIAGLNFETPGEIDVGEMIRLFHDDDQLGEFIRRYGPANTVHLLSENRAQVGGDCHQRAHDLGRVAYAAFGAAAFSLSGHECQSGGFHGATEALFRDHGAATLGTDVALICGNRMNSFFRHQCVHGVGHGLMAWTNYELIEALELCESLETDTDQLSCFSGTFMENVVGGLSGIMGHFTDYLSDDPHYPCNVLDERQMQACYFYQTSRMVQLFGGDFAKVAAACAAAPESAHYTCFQSMGRDVGAAARGNPQQAVAFCGFVESPGRRSDCLAGAVQDWFWDENGADDALSFCTFVEDGTVRGRCYRTLLDRSQSIYATAAGVDAFCRRIEEWYGGCA